MAVNVSASRVRNLVPILISKWSKLRDVYKQEWPKHAYSYYALDNYCRLARNEPELCKRTISIWSSDENWQQHGVFFLEDNLNNYKTLRVDVTSHDYLGVFLKGLNDVDLKPYAELMGRENTALPILQHMELCGYNHKSSMFSPFFIMAKEKALEMDVSARSDFVIKPLTVKDVPEISSNWVHRNEGTDYVLARNIRNNITFGAYHPESGELCGWIMNRELGTIGLRHVKDKFRGCGLGESLSYHMCYALAKDGRNPITHTVTTNEPTMRLLKKLDCQPMGYDYWFYNWKKAP